MLELNKTIFRFKRKSVYRRQKNNIKSIESIWFTQRRVTMYCNLSDLILKK